MKSHICMLSTAVFLTLALADCAQNPGSGRPDFVTMSETPEMQVGRKVIGVLENQELFCGKHAYLIGGQAKTGEALRAALPQIDATITRFHAGVEERAAVRPLTLRVINAPPGATIVQLAQRSPRGEPASGQPLKIIE